MRIAICDDSAHDLEILVKSLNEYIKLHNINLTYDTFNDPAKLLPLDSIKYDAYFLDVVMQKNGIDVAREIRGFDKTTPIIFITSSKEFAIPAFKVKAFDYVLKPIAKDQLYSCLDGLFEHLNVNKRNAISVKTNDHNLVTVEIKSISYIESNDRRMIIHLYDKSMIYTTSLRTKFLDSIPFDYLSYNFINCHNSFVVNMNHIKSIEDTQFILKNNEMVPISKRMITQVKKTYIKYLLGE